MARFSAELPNELMKQLGDLIDGGADEMMDEMLTSAADYVEEEIRQNARKVFKSAGTVLSGLNKTRIYRTDKDDSKNIKVGFSGYIAGSKRSARYPKGTPIALVALAREYGTSSGEAKKPFVRPAFKKGKISDVMMKVQKKYIPED